MIKFVESLKIQKSYIYLCSIILNHSHKTDRTMTTEMQINNVAEIQLMYSAKYKVSEMPKVCSSKDAFRVLQNFWPVQRIEYLEDFFILLLNRANKIIGMCKLS